MEAPSGPCSLCSRSAAFGPFGGARICEGCAKRIADLATRSPLAALANVWGPIANPPGMVPEHPQVRGILEDFKQSIRREAAQDDARSHLDLAIAYREMGLCADALREAAFALRATSDRRIVEDALRLLLTPPLLAAGGLEALRARLSTN